MSLPDSLDLFEYSYTFYFNSSFRLEYCWLSWGQKDHPFSQRSLNYIKNIDIMKDIKLLDDSLNIRPICLRNMKISCTVLKNGASAGLTLGEIGKIWARTDDEGEVKSVMEVLVERAQRQADIVQELRNFRTPSVAKDLLTGNKN